jgi:hypothetical protein
LLNAKPVKLVDVEQREDFEFSRFKYYIERVRLTDQELASIGMISSPSVFYNTFEEELKK